MDMTLTEKLREDACILRKLHKEGKGLDELRAHKTRMLARSTACSASAWASLPRPLPLSTAIRTTTSTVKRA